MPDAMPAARRFAVRAVLAGCLGFVGMATGLAATGEQGARQSEAAANVTTVQQQPLPHDTNVAVTDRMMQRAGGDQHDWLLHGRDYGNQRFSPLDQITPDTIAKLAPVAIVQTGVAAAFAATPIVVNGVMYISTPEVDGVMKVLAVNAASGERYWATRYRLSRQGRSSDQVNRGVAVGYGSVFVLTPDDRLLALNAKSGKLQWQVTVADASKGYTETMAPQVFDGMVIIGSASGASPLRGFVAAYDAHSGEQKWRWHSTDPNSYAGESWKTGGGMVPTTPAIDIHSGLLIFSVASPAPALNGQGRKGDNLYTDAIVALDVHNGQLKWFRQEVKHDVWNYGAVGNVVLFDLRQDKQTIPVAAEAGKVGRLFIVNRDNGQLIRKSDPLVKMSKTMFSPPGKQGTEIMPGANGGAGWSPPAYSPHTHLFYVMGINQRMTFTSESPHATGAVAKRGGTVRSVQGDKAVRDGVLDAVNVATGKISWQYHAPQPMVGGVLATAGNLVFAGEGDGWFDAFNASSGDRVWRYYLGAGVNAPPVSYEITGQQYIAVAVGGNARFGYPRGDVVAIFRLNG